MSKKREPIHFVNAEMLAECLDEHDGELPHQWQERELYKLNYGCADIDDIDGIIAQMYGDD